MIKSFIMSALFYIFSIDLRIQISYVYLVSTPIVEDTTFCFLFMERISGLSLMMKLDSETFWARKVQAKRCYIPDTMEDWRRRLSRPGVHEMSASFIKMLDERFMSGLSAA